MPVELIVPHLHSAVTWLHSSLRLTPGITRSILPTNWIAKSIKYKLVEFGRVVLARWSDPQKKNVEFKFIGAKGKLNPIKGTTVPKSELYGEL